MKLLVVAAPAMVAAAAAFGRLCVETTGKECKEQKPDAAAFGRLCVETRIFDLTSDDLEAQPPSGGCVLKQEQRMTVKPPATSSRLRAAVC